MAAPKDATAQSATNQSDSKSDDFKAAYEKLLKLEKDTPSSQQQHVLSEFISNHTNTFDFKPYSDFVTKESNGQLFKTFVHSLSANKDNHGMYKIFKVISITLSRYYSQ